jgi:hypothetical protein
MDHAGPVDPRTVAPAVAPSNTGDRADKPCPRNPTPAPTTATDHRQDQLQLVVDGPSGTLPPAAARALLQFVLAASSSAEP